MKKIFVVAALAASVFTMFSCEKANQLADENQSIKINVTVGNLDTKALKTGWVNGDIINVYLDNVTAYTPDFTLTYDGTKWVASELSSDAISRLQPSGMLKGFWEASNSALSTWNRWESLGKYFYFDYPDQSNASTTGVRTQVTAQFYYIPYTYSAGKLIATIDDWKFTTNFEMVVTGLPDGTYSLYTGANMLTACDRISIDSNLAQVSMWGNASASHRIGGVANADGVAFVGRVARPTVLQDYVFYLTDHGADKTYSYTKNVSLPTSSENVLLGAKVPFSKFTEI